VSGVRRPKPRGKVSARSGPGVEPMSTQRRARYPVAGVRAARLVAAFARKHLIHVDGELPPNGVAFEPIEFVPFQWLNIILPIFANVDRRGRRIVKKALIGLARDAAKSEVAAVIVLAIAFLEPKYKGQYYFLARNKEQATAVFDKVSTMVLHDPMLRRACVVLKDTILIKETKAKLMVLPGDDKSVQSKHADVVVVDEYHVHKSDALLSAMQSGMIGNWDQGALLIVLTTAGTQRKGPLWGLIAKWRDDPTAHVYWCGATDHDDPDDPKVWRRANPMPWISISALSEAHRSLPPWDFERYHLNRFPSTGRLVAFDAKSWDALDALPVIDPERPCTLGADASFSRDTTALVLDQVDGGGVHNWLAWIIKADEPGVPIDRGLVMATTLEIVQTYFVARMVCDPNYFVLEMMELANSHGVPVEIYRQSAERMARAYDMMWAVVQSARARHGGAAGLREHVLNAGQQPTAYGPRLTKVEDALKIDAAVACAMATAIAEAEYQETCGGLQIAVG
jgi:phage terminase large subunit-like protein